MSPPLTARMAEAIKAGRGLALLAEIDHPDGMARYWTGVGTLEWDGETWTGIGQFGGVAPVKQTNDLAIQEVHFALGGVDATLLAQLTDNVRNRTGMVWLAAIGERGEVVPDPYIVVDALLDYQTFSVGGDGAAEISIIARTGFYTLERGVDDVWSSEDQKQTYPTDSGLDLISSLQNADIQWTPT